MLDSTQINNINKELTVHLPIEADVINEDILPNFFGLKNNLPVELKRGAAIDVDQLIIYIEKQYKSI